MPRLCNIEHWLKCNAAVKNGFGTVCFHSKLAGNFMIMVCYHCVHHCILMACSKTMMAFSHEAGKQKLVAIDVGQ